MAEETNKQPSENGEEKSQEITKRSIRVQTWKKFQEHRCAAPPIDVFNKIPNFKGAEKAAALLAELDEFKKAKNVKVNIDRGQEPVKLEVIKAGKNLFVPPSKEASIPSLFTKVVCPEGLELADQRKYVRLQGSPESKTEVGIDTEIKLDMYVVGSVAVSKKGQRIGKGHGYVDLDFGILTKLGVITKDTVVVTTVHDVQVYDDLPAELFQKYDLPLDIIVTPEEVIRVEKRLPRPTGIEWSLLSQRRVNLIPALGALKEKEEKAGKVIVLKSEDTDIESNRKPRTDRRRMRRTNRRRKSNRRSTTDNENAESNAENETEPGRQQKRRRQRRYGRNVDRKNEQQNGAESDGGAGNKEGGQGAKKDGRQRQRQRKNNRDLCIKVSNIAKNVRIKELKTELREKGFNPTFISWKGSFGKCYLHFAKKRDQDEDKATNDILTALSSLSLNVKCEVVKRDAKNENGGDSQTENRIETTDVTAV